MDRFTIYAGVYIGSLKNMKKRAYARAFFEYMQDSEEGDDSPEPDGLSYMAAQAVRMNLEDAHERAEQFEKFQLAPQPAIVAKRATFQSSKTTQRVLITGLGCCRGQESLFDTDGSK